MNTYKNKHIKLIWFFFFMSISINVQSAEDDQSLTIDDLGFATLEFNIQTHKSSTALLKAQNSYTEARVEHHKKLMGIESKTYLIQQVMSFLVFLVVTVLVFGGMWLSYLQFKGDITNEVPPNGEKTKATFKIGKDGIEFSSSVIGLIVLFMSFFFFHLYISEVYTIKPNKVEALQFSQGADTQNPNKQ